MKITSISYRTTFQEIRAEIYLDACKVTALAAQILLSEDFNANDLKVQNDKYAKVKGPINQNQMMKIVSILERGKYLPISNSPSFPMRRKVDE